MTRGLPVFLLAGSACVFTACTATHLYDGGNHDLALQARDAFAKADLAGSVQGEFALLEEMLAREIEIVGRHTLARRDSHLVAIIGATDAEHSWRFLEDAIAARLGDLAGRDEARSAALREAISLLPVYRARVEEHRLLYDAARRTGDPSVSCPLPSSFDATRISPEARPFFDLFRKACGKLEAARRTLHDFDVEGSLFGEVNRDLVAAADLTRVAGEQAALVRRAHAELREKIEARTMEDPPIDVTSEVGKAREALDERLSQLISAGEKLAGALERLGLGDLRLDLLGYVVDGDGDPPEGLPDGVRLRLEMVRALPAIATELRSGLRYPRVSSLLLEAERLRLSIEHLRSRLARAGRRVDLLRRKREAMADELAELTRARSALREIKKALGHPPDEPWPAAVETASLFETYRSEDGIRRHVGELLLAYADSFSLGRLPQEEVDYLLIGLTHEAALDGSATAVAQWENLIRVPLAQLVALHASGITPEQISNLIQAAGFTAVGIGVN
jgi:hypothetical protein